MSFIVGETVGPYRITEQLGSGGMATVFKAYHAALDRYVAIKVLHPAFKEDPNFLARFQREARVVAKLEHPNIVPVYDFSDHKGQPYLVMRFIEGETLKARLGRGALPARETVRIVQSVGAALTYAHGQGVLHRDIKPSNVMLTPKGDVFLADFGLARIAQAGESTLSQDSMLGTPQYISPEQAKGERELDARTDVYSLGVVVYELLVGRVPYQADTPYAVVHDHIFTPLPLPRSINQALPEPLERFLLKALSKDRDDRFASVESMMEGLNRAVEQAGLRSDSVSVSTVTTGSAPTIAGPPRPQSAAAKTPVSSWVWIALGAVVMVAVVAVILLTRTPQVPASPGQATPAAGTPAAPSPDKPPRDAGEAARKALDEASALFRQANEQVVQAHPEQARETFRRAAETAESGVAAFASPGSPEENALHVVAAQSWLAAGHGDRAEPHLVWLIDTGPDKPRALAGLGIARLLQDQPDAALAHAEEALRGDAALAEAHAVKGCALLKKGDRLLALREFNQARESLSGAETFPPWFALLFEQLDCRMER